jgi:hypothetical protein
MTEEQRAAKNAYMREWKRKNKEKVNLINLRVKAKNPELYRRINRVSAAKQRAADPERFADTQLRFIQNNAHRYLLMRAKKRAAEQGLPFDINDTDIEIPELCPVLGIRLECDVGRRLSHNRTSPSLDRLRPERGYVKGNVRVISNRANHLKNNGSLEEFKAIVAYLERELG